MPERAFKLAMVQMRVEPGDKPHSSPKQRPARGDGWDKLWRARS